jgi:hypothetical protein
MDVLSGDRQSALYQMTEVLSPHDTNAGISPD